MTFEISRNKLFFYFMGTETFTALKYQTVVFCPVIKCSDERGTNVLKELLPASLEEDLQRKYMEVNDPR